LIVQPMQMRVAVFPVQRVVVAWALVVACVC
jgi:hypothetical protein